MALFCATCWSLREDLSANVGHWMEIKVVWWSDKLPGDGRMLAVAMHESKELLTNM